MVSGLGGKDKQDDEQMDFDISPVSLRLMREMSFSMILGSWCYQQRDQGFKGEEGGVKDRFYWRWEQKLAFKR